MLVERIQAGLLLLRYGNVVHFFAVFGYSIVRLRAGFSIFRNNEMDGMSDFPAFLDDELESSAINLCNSHGS